jgi:hypothetical protein
MALYTLFRNLFIPQKNLIQFDPVAFRTDMAAVENWANQVQLSFDTLIGNPIPDKVQSTLQLITFAGTAAGGVVEYNFPVAYKYGYVALVSSGDSAAADSAALSLASNLDTLQVYLTLAGAPVSGSVIVVALMVGA